MTDCCVPPAPRRLPAPAAPVPIADTAVAPHNQALPLVQLPGGDFMMGDSFGEGYTADGERPVHLVRITGFELSPTQVTNHQFAAFAAATGYPGHVTLAGEHKPH